MNAVLLLQFFVREMLRRRRLSGCVQNLADFANDKRLTYACFYSRPGSHPDRLRYLLTLLLRASMMIPIHSLSSQPNAVVWKVVVKRLTGSPKESLK
jgi:hypothetical protein